MPTPQDLNRTGNAMRGAFETLLGAMGSPPDNPFLNYLFQTMSNHLLQLEREDGVPAGFYGSQGAPLMEINPATGAPMPLMQGELPPPRPEPLPLADPGPAPGPPAGP